MIAFGFVRLLNFCQSGCEMVSHYAFNLHVICISLRGCQTGGTDSEEVEDTSAGRESPKSGKMYEISCLFLSSHPPVFCKCLQLEKPTWNCEIKEVLRV